MMQQYYCKLLLFISISFLFLSFTNKAKAAILYFVPSSEQIIQNEVVPIQVRINTESDRVNAVSAYISYSKDLLDVAWIEGSGVFSISAEESKEPGLIKISKGGLSEVSGDALVATVGIRGKHLGNATLSFTSGSAAPKASDSSDSLSLARSKGAVLKIIPEAKKLKNSVATDSSKQELLSPSEGDSNNACKSKEDQIKKRMLRIYDISQALKIRLDTIFTVVEKFYQITPSVNYNQNIKDLYNKTVSKKQYTEQTLSKMRQNVDSFTCDTSTPYHQVTVFKDTVSNSNNILKEYKNALREWILELQKII